MGPLIVTDATGQAGQRPLPLTDAAARLGLSTDALRKRCERGKVGGAYKLDGRWWVPVADVTGSTGPTGQPSSGDVRSDDRSVTTGQAGQVLQAAMAALTDQLAVKDRQIAERDAEVARLHALLERLSGPPELATPPAARPVPDIPDSPHPPRRPWWRFW